MEPSNFLPSAEIETNVYVAEGQVILRNGVYWASIRTQLEDAVVVATQIVNALNLSARNGEAK